MKYISGLLLTLIAFTTNFYSQTGPGGVGANDGSSSLKMWYRPDFGITAGTNVSAWQNAAGVAAHDLTAAGANQPTFNASSLNGYDELSFDNIP